MAMESAVQAIELWNTGLPVGRIGSDRNWNPVLWIDMSHGLLSEVFMKRPDSQMWLFSQTLVSEVALLDRLHRPSSR